MNGCSVKDRDLPGPHVMRFGAGDAERGGRQCEDNGLFPHTSSPRLHGLSPTGGWIIFAQFGS